MVLRTTTPVRMTWVISVRNRYFDQPNGDRVRRLRVSAGLWRADLAEKISVPVVTVSKIENQRQLLDQGLVERLVGALGCTEELLGKPLPDALYTKPWLRAYADASKKLVDQYIDDSLLAAEAFEASQLRCLPDVLPTFTGDPGMTSPLSSSLRMSARLPTSPTAASLTRHGPWSDSAASCSRCRTNLVVTGVYQCE